MRCSIATLPPAFRLLDEAFPADARPRCGFEVSVSLLLCVAQWVDLGYRTLAFLNVLEAELPRIQMARLEHSLDYLKLRSSCKGTGCSPPSISMKHRRCFAVVLKVGNGVLGNYLSFLANFWKGRAHRKLGDYDLAAANFSAARFAAVQAGAAKLVAVIKIHDSWLAFQSGKRQHAFDLLNEAEAELLPTGHSLSLGNIESARGRFVRRSGDYAARPAPL